MMLKAVVEKTRRYTALVVFAVLFLLNVSPLRVFSCPFSRRRSIRRWINQPTIEQIEKFVVLTNGTSGVYSNKEVEDDGTVHHSVVFEPVSTGAALLTWLKGPDVTIEEARRVVSQLWLRLSYDEDAPDETRRSGSAMTKTHPVVVPDGSTIEQLIKVVEERVKPHRETAVSTGSAKKLNQIAPGREPRDAKNKRVPWCGKFEGNEQGPPVLPFSLTSVSPDWTCHYPPTSSILLFLSPCFSL